MTEYQKHSNEEAQSTENEKGSIQTVSNDRRVSIHQVLTSQDPKDIQDLERHFKVLYPELSAEDRLKVWINHMENQHKLRPLPVEATAFKTVFIVEDRPDVIIKRFDKGGDQAASFEGERREFAIVKNYLSDAFLPSTRFVVRDNESKEDEKYYILQDRLQGVHAKAATSEAQEMIHQHMSPEEIDEMYVQQPENWTRLRGEIIRKKLTSQQWDKARKNAQKLYDLLLELEKNYRLNDLDFFVTDEGDIKIIDCQVYPIESYTPDPEGFPDGSREVQVMFNL